MNNGEKKNKRSKEKMICHDERSGVYTVLFFWFFKDEKKVSVSFRVSINFRNKKKINMVSVRLEKW